MSEDQKQFNYQEKKTNDPVECLGVTFASDKARREYFTEKLQEKLKDPEFRNTEGFPLGSDEDILAMSDPPYYTACPNPFFHEFVRQYGKIYEPGFPYNRKPFAVDVSQGKTDPLYKAHSYHTKVPHLAIVPSILHYTNPGDLVLDGFCGSGMTGVAAQWCGRPPQDYRDKLEAECKRDGRPIPEWGTRRVLLNDLSPAATFITANYNLPFDVDLFSDFGNRLLIELDREIGWMYETTHSDGKTKGKIQYTVWSEVFTCPNCASEIVFLKEALDPDNERVRKHFPCPHCGVDLNKESLERLFHAEPDPASGTPWKHVRFKPSLISYVVGGSTYEKEPDNEDLALLKRIGEVPLPTEIPTVRFPIEQMYHGSRIEPKGFSYTHQFFLPRAARALGLLWKNTISQPDPKLRQTALFFVEQAIWGLSILARYAPTHYSQVNQFLNGVYYIPSQHAECSPWYILNGKLKRLTKTFKKMTTHLGSACISTASADSLGIPAASVDYIFTDPPFGENIYYADLNFLVEAWHRVSTNSSLEAIVDKPKNKGLADYQHLMQRCFEEYYRVLKPGRWMTVVFHNSLNAVWNSIQEAMMASGFVVADVRTLDKQQGSFRQLTSTAPKQDLVISAYKPNGGLEDRFKLKAGTEEAVWDYVGTHLRQLAMPVIKDGVLQVNQERMNHRLYDQMVAFHVQRGVAIPLSAAEFHEGLSQRFAERDGMYFLSEQVTEYDGTRLRVSTVAQLELFVVDESSAIQWLGYQLSRKPQTFQELHPQFLREIGGWQRSEISLELSDLLDQSFLRYDGAGEVPSQIHSYLSTNFRDLRGMTKEDPTLRAKAKDRWYVPDPKKAGDLEKRRERSLLKEFEDYRQSRQRRLRVFRLEAVRAGFKRAYQERDYATIIEVAQKIPENVLQEDAKLLMWYDQALTRSGDSA